MSSLMAMMEKLLEQNSEIVRQVDGAPTTSSFTVQLFNTEQKSTHARNFCRTK